MNGPRSHRSRAVVELLFIVFVVAGTASLAACGAASSSEGGSPSPLSAEVAAPATPEPTTSGPGTIAFTKGTISGMQTGNEIRSLGIYVVRSDGSGLKRLAADGGRPAWSPDGSKIAYISNAGVSVMNADGSEQRQVVTGGAWWWRVAWSPDGGKLALTMEGGGLAVVNADGSGYETVIAGSQGTTYDHPAWAPDGRIFFTRTDTNNLAEISSVNPDGSGLAVVTAAEPLTTFSLSLDGKWLMICDGRGLVRQAADGHGTAVVLVDRSSLHGAPSAFFIPDSGWAPNGRKLAVAADAGAWIGPSPLYIVRLDGRSDPKVVPNVGLGWNPVWRPQ